MSFIEINMVKEAKVLVKAHYDHILLMPFILIGALIVLTGLFIKNVGFGMLVWLLDNLEMPPFEFAAMGDWVFIIFLLVGIGFTLFSIIRTTGIELAVTDSILIGRYKKDAMCVPIEKVENLAIYKNIFGRIFKYGTITIGTPSITMKFPYISEPEKFRDKVLELRDERICSLGKR